MDPRKLLYNIHYSDISWGQSESLQAEATPPSSPRGEEPASASQDSIEVQKSRDIPAQFYDDASFPTTIPINPFDMFKRQVLDLLKAYPEGFTKHEIVSRLFNTTPKKVESALARLRDAGHIYSERISPAQLGDSSDASRVKYFAKVYAHEEQATASASHREETHKFHTSSSFTGEVWRCLREKPGERFTKVEIEQRLPSILPKQIKAGIDWLKMMNAIHSAPMTKEEIGARGHTGRGRRPTQYFYKSPDETSDLGAKVTNQRDPE